MNSFGIVSKWISDDEFRLECLRFAKSVVKPEWYISAGFVRNLVWDKLQGHKERTPLNDIDFIYFDPANISPDQDHEIENYLIKAMPACNWSVKNQARMSFKHGHESYRDCIDAMSYWPEIQTAVGVTVTSEGELSVASPFTASEIIKLAVTRNPKCTSRVFQDRISGKGWPKLWPGLKIER